MVGYNKLREFLSDMEHEQWMHWSKTLSQELIKIKDCIFLKQDIKALCIINDRLKRWKNCWIPYKKLSSDVKDYDREWADKILDNVPNKCPVYQCGGLMTTKERKLPKDFIESEHYNGDEQTPDLVCTNCGAVYQFQKFIGGKEKQIY